MKTSPAVNSVVLTFLALHTLFIWALPFALYVLLFGWIAGGILGALWIVIEVAVIIWVVRERRRRWGHFWPAKEDKSAQHGRKAGD